MTANGASGAGAVGPLAAEPATPARRIEELLRVSTKVRSLDDVVLQLREVVVSGRVLPGQRLPSERALTELMQVSRATVREALRALEAVGLVDIRLGGSGGAFVRSPDPRMIGSALSTTLVMQGATEGELTEYRLTFERENAALAAERATSEERAHLQELLDQVRATDTGLEDWAGIEGLDFSLHELLPRLTHNSVRVAIGLGIHDALRRSFDQVPPSSAGASALRADVEQLLTALLSGDPEASATAMVEHIRRWRD